MTIELAVLSTASAALDFCEKTQKPSAWEAWARTFGRLFLEARGASMDHLDTLHASEALTEDIEALFDEIDGATHERISILTYAALEAAAKSHAESAYEALERQTEALNVIANASKRAEGMFGGSMSEVTRVFENITRVSSAALANARAALARQDEASQPSPIPGELKALSDAAPAGEPLIDIVADAWAAGFEGASFFEVDQEKLHFNAFEYAKNRLAKTHQVAEGGETS